VRNLGLGDLGFLVAAGRPAAPWTPAYIATALWLDAADASTVIGGSQVGQWNDKSGNNRHATQSAPGSRPSSTTNTINGLTVITFDGSNDFMDVSTTVLQGQSEPNLFYVFSRYGAGSGDVYRCEVSILAGDANDAGAFHYVKNSNNLGASYPFFGTWGNYDLSSGTAYANNTPEIIGFNAFSNAWRVHRNGTQEGPTGLVGVAPSSNFVGIRLAQQLNPLRTANIGIGELILAFGTSVNDRQRIEGYLAHKWGLAAKLPSDHPYKSAAPTL